MNRSVVALAVLAATAGIVAVYQSVQLRGERERNRELVARVTTLESGAPVPQVVAAPDSAIPQVAATQATSATAAPAAKQPAERADNPMMAGIQQMMNSAEGQEFARSMMRSMLPQMYPDLGKELGLTAEETEKLFDLLAKHQNDLGMETLGMISGGPQDPAAMGDLQRRIMEKEQAQEAELAAMLGSRYPKWQEYQTTQAARQQVDQLRSALNSSEHPLSAAQSRSLVTAFTAEQKRMEQEERSAAPAVARNSTNLMDDELQRATASQRRFLDVAQPYLTSAQLEEYKRHMEQQENMMRTMMKAMGATGNAP